MKILRTYISVFQRLIGLVNSPDETWQKIDEENSRKQIFGLFFYPLLLLAAGLFFVSKIAVFQDVNITKATLETIFMAISFLCAYFICKKICQATTKQIYKIELSDIQLDKIVIYALSVILVVKVLAELLDFQFMNFFWLYSAFIFWKICDVILKLQDDGKNRELFLIINTLSVICVPFIIEYILLKLFI